MVYSNRFQPHTFTVEKIPGESMNEFHAGRFCFSCPPRFGGENVKPKRGTMSSQEDAYYSRAVKVPADGITGTPDYDECAEKITSDTKGRVDRLLIPRFSLMTRIRKLAGQISDDYRDTEILYMVVILKGAFIFASDLAREIFNCGGPEVRFAFIKASTYRKEIKESGEKRRETMIELKPKGIQGKNVLIVEDIIDQGFTLPPIKRLLLEEEIGSLKICTLLNKILSTPSKEVEQAKKSLQIDYVGFEIPDRWVAGYGIDAGEDFRHLPFIITINEHYYLS